MKIDKNAGKQVESAAKVNQNDLKPKAEEKTEETSKKKEKKTKEYFRDEE